MHVHCFSVRSSSSFGNEVVDERSVARGVKKKTALIAATCPQWEIDVSALSLRKLVSPPLLNLHRILHSWCVK